MRAARGQAADTTKSVRSQPSREGGTGRTMKAVYAFSPSRIRADRARRHLGRRYGSRRRRPISASPQQHHTDQSQAQRRAFSVGAVAPKRAPPPPHGPSLRHRRAPPRTALPSRRLDDERISHSGAWVATRSAVGTYKGRKGTSIGKMFLGCGGRIADHTSHLTSSRLGRAWCWRLLLVLLVVA